MPKTLHTIADSVKETPRLASIQDPIAFQELLKTRYTSELEAWQKMEPKDSWKSMLLRNEQTIRQLQKKIKLLEAELW
jgi:hypothetical protein